MQQAQANVKPDLLCFSHLRWNFVYQRPQHLLSRAARQYRVHFFEEPLYETASVPRLEVTAAAPDINVVVPILPAQAEAGSEAVVLRGLLDFYLGSLRRAPEVGWYYTPMALRFSGHLRFSVCVYDCMDELTGFKGAPPDLAGFEYDLMDRVQVMFTGGLSLFEAKRRLHPNVQAFPSSVDVAHFLPARSASLRPPADMAAIPGPRIGFFGVIDERLDIGIVRRMAELRPHYQFVMIGPTVKIDPASLPRGPNIHWLGGKEYADLPSYLSCLDVGFMPFALNEATRFISPTKTPEFLAAGLPVVSTAIVDVARTWGAWGLVEIAGDANEAAQAVDRLLARSDEDAASWLAIVDQKLSSTSWDATWTKMLEHMRASSPPPTREKAPEQVNHP